VRGDEDVVAQHGWKILLFFRKSVFDARPRGVTDARTGQ
jgi:hypothetical protein